MAEVPPPGARSRPDVTLKISLAGEAGVGKSSLARRFVTDTFDDAYVPTLGTRVSSRQFLVDDPRRPGSLCQVGASVWDIMGSHTFRDLLKDAYFVNASGLLLVCDIARPQTLYDLPQWYEIVSSVAGPIPTAVLANKSDLRGPDSLPVEAIQALCDKLECPWFEASAKTGANVEAAFQYVAREHLVAARRAPELTVRA
jgi:small GTP-binding protein